MFKYYIKLQIRALLSYPHLYVFAFVSKWLLTSLHQDKKPFKLFNEQIKINNSLTKKNFRFIGTRYKVSANPLQIITYLGEPLLDLLAPFCNLDPC